MAYSSIVCVPDAQSVLLSKHKKGI